MYQDIPIGFEGLQEFTMLGGLMQVLIKRIKMCIIIVFWLFFSNPAAKGLQQCIQPGVGLLELYA